MPAPSRVSQAEKDRRRYWAEKRARERAAGQGRESTDPNHPHNHRCTERTIDYGDDTVHRCTVCGRTWTLTTVPVGKPSDGNTVRRWVPNPLTAKRPPLPPEG